MQEWPIVGRDGPTGLISGWLTDAAPTAILVRGAAGIGKSCVVEQALAGLDHPRVLRLRAGPAMRTSPYEGLSLLLPEVMVANAGDRLGLVQAALDHLGPSASPWVIWVDDVPNADPETLVVLFHAVTNGLASLVLTARDGEAIPAPVLALAEDGVLETLQLGPLTEADVSHLLERALRGRVDRSTVRRLFDRSAGNPLLLRELVRAALADGSLHEGAEAWHWSAHAGGATGIGDLAVRHLDELDADAEGLFECLALMGACSVREAEVLAGSIPLAELVRTRTAVVDHHDGLVRPAHPLFAEAALARMTVGTRQARVRHLLAVVAPSPDRPLDELRRIRWRREVHDPMTPGELADATTLALGKFDVPLAIELGRAALEAGQDAVALTLALALIYAGHLEDAAVVLERAVAIAGTEGDRVFAAVTRTLNRAYRTGFEPSIADEHAALQATLTEPGLITMVQSERTSALAFAGRLGEAVALGAPYVVDGEAAPWDALAYLPGWAISASTLGRTDAVFRAVTALEHAAEPRAGRHVAWFHFVRAQAALLHGDLELAEHSMGRFAEEAHLAMVPGVPAELLAEKLGIIALWRGDIVLSQRLLTEAVALCDVPESNFRRVFPLSYLAMAHALAGDATRARAAADEARTWVRWLPLGEGYAVAADAWATAASGDLTGATRIAMAGADRCAALGLGSPALWCAADAMRFGPSPATARRVVALAEEVDGRWSAAFAAVARAWLAKDVGQMAAAVEAFRVIGALVHAADAQQAQSLLAAQLGRTATARSVAQQGSATRSTCPGLRWSGPTGDRVGAVPGTSTVDGADARLLVAALTGREREVARLAAQGRSNAQIATQLGLSVRTVEGHAHRAMTKLTIRRRADLEPLLPLLG